MAIQNVCPLCGKVNPDAEWVCEDCGTKLPAARPHTASAPQSQSQPIPANAPSQVPPEYEHLQRSFNNFGRVFFAIFIGAALLIGLVGAATALKTSRSQSWPTVQGEVTYSSIDRSSSGFNNPRRQRRTTPSFSPSIRYVYQVKGVRYNGSRITLIGWSGNINEARAAAGKYPVGAHVPVYYNPANPEDSLLEPGDQSNNLMAIGMGGLFVVIGAVGGYFWFRPSKRN